MFIKEIAKNYDNWYKNLPGSFVDELESAAAFSLFQPASNSNVLDVGCGTGNYSIKLAKKGYNVTGVDISNDMLDIARIKADKQRLNINFVNGDLNCLEFPDNSFSAVCSMTAFEFIKNPHNAFQELFRVVKPGGFILIGTINKESLWGEAYISNARQDENSVFNYAYFKSIEELRNLDQYNCIASKECLFIPPNAPNADFNWKMENYYSQHNSGGFIMCLWQKP